MASSNKPEKVYTVYKDIEGFSFCMPNGWDDYTLSVFLEGCHKYIEDLRGAREDIESQWSRVVKYGLEMTSNFGCFNISVTMELAKVLKLFLLKNEFSGYYLNFEAFKELLNDTKELLPYFPNWNESQIPSFRDKIRNLRDENKPLDLANVVLTVSKQYSHLFGVKGIPASILWSEMNQKVLEKSAVKIDVKTFLEPIKLNIVDEVRKITDSQLRTTKFRTLAKDYLSFFDYIPPRNIKKSEFLPPELLNDDDNSTNAMASSSNYHMNEIIDLSKEDFSDYGLNSQMRTTSIDNFEFVSTKKSEFLSPLLFNNDQNSISNHEYNNANENTVMEYLEGIQVDDVGAYCELPYSVNNINVSTNNDLFNFDYQPLFQNTSLSSNDIQLDGTSFASNVSEMFNDNLLLNTEISEELLQCSVDSLVDEPMNIDDDPNCPTTLVLSDPKSTDKKICNEEALVSTETTTTTNDGTNHIESGIENIRINDLLQDQDESLTTSIIQHNKEMCVGSTINWEVGENVEVKNTENITNILDTPERPISSALTIEKETVTKNLEYQENIINTTNGKVDKQGACVNSTIIVQNGVVAIKSRCDKMVTAINNKAKVNSLSCVEHEVIVKNLEPAEDTINTDSIIHKEDTSTNSKNNIYEEATKDFDDKTMEDGKHTNKADLKEAKELVDSLINIIEGNAFDERISFSNKFMLQEKEFTPEKLTKSSENALNSNICLTDTCGIDTFTPVNTFSESSSSSVTPQLCSSINYETNEKTTNTLVDVQMSDNTLQSDVVTEENTDVAICKNNIMTNEFENDDPINTNELLIKIQNSCTGGIKSFLGMLQGSLVYSGSVNWYSSRRFILNAIRKRFANNPKITSLLKSCVVETMADLFNLMNLICANIDESDENQEITEEVTTIEAEVYLAEDDKDKNYNDRDIKKTKGSSPEKETRLISSQPDNRLLSILNLDECQKDVTSEPILTTNTESDEKVKNGSQKMEVDECSSQSKSLTFEQNKTIRRVKSEDNILHVSAAKTQPKSGMDIYEAVKVLFSHNREIVHQLLDLVKNLENGGNKNSYSNKGNNEISQTIANGPTDLLKNRSNDTEYKQINNENKTTPCLSANQGSSKHESSIAPLSEFVSDENKNLQKKSNTQEPDSCKTDIVTYPKIVTNMEELEVNNSDIKMDVGVQKHKKGKRKRGHERGARNKRQHMLESNSESTDTNMGEFGCSSKMTYSDFKSSEPEGQSENRVLFNSDQNESDNNLGSQFHGFSVISTNKVHLKRIKLMNLIDTYKFRIKNRVSPMPEKPINLHGMNYGPVTVKGKRVILKRAKVLLVDIGKNGLNLENESFLGLGSAPTQKMDVERRSAIHNTVKERDFLIRDNENILKANNMREEIPTQKVDHNLKHDEIHNDVEERDSSRDNQILVEDNDEMREEIPTEEVEHNLLHDEIRNDIEEMIFSRDDETVIGAYNMQEEIHNNVKERDFSRDNQIVVEACNNMQEEIQRFRNHVPTMLQPFITNEDVRAFQDYAISEFSHGKLIINLMELDPQFDYNFTQDLLTTFPYSPEMDCLTWYKKFVTEFITHQKWKTLLKLKLENEIEGIEQNKMCLMDKVYKALLDLDNDD